MLGNIKVVQIHTGIKNNSSPYRMHLALKKIGIVTKILAKDSNVFDDNIRIIKPNICYRFLRKIDYILLNIDLKRRYVINEYVPYSYYNVGIDLSKENEIKEADVIQLHWTCGSYLSYSGINKLLKLKKTTIIVCHDNWHFTGGCHVTLGCDKYTKACEMCPQLKSQIKKDWSNRMLKRKEKIYKNRDIIIVSPSTWMDSNVAKSILFKEKRHFIIPNPINTERFKKYSKEQIRNKMRISNEKIILTFGAINAVNTPYKGYTKLLEALDILEEKYLGSKEIEAVVFGAQRGDERKEKKISIKYMGYLNENEMVEMYNCADIYVVPSLEDSFNNTVAECLACETPVVSFSTGGIVDIIDHKQNGYLAKYGNSEDLANGIIWVMNNNHNNNLGKNGRKKVVERFDEKVIAEQWMRIYKMEMEACDD